MLFEIEIEEGRVSKGRREFARASSHYRGTIMATLVPLSSCEAEVEVVKF